MRVSAFIWDNHNQAKCEKHGLNVNQIEEFLLTEPQLVDDEEHSNEESRYIAFGYYNKRFLFVVFTLRVHDNKLKFRVISARYARAKEITKLQDYENHKK